jgi:hypothetical protein
MTEKKETTPAGEMIKGFESDMAESLISGVLPKIKPFIKPMLSELNKYLGDEDKTIIIRKKGDKSALVIIFDNTKDFSVVGGNVTNEEGKVISNKGKLSGEKGACLQVFSIDQFVDMLINGKLTEFIGKF